MEKTLKFLGTDAGYGKNNNSAYIELADKLIIVDCGFAIFNKLIDGFDLKKYNQIEIIITHLHNDHAGSLSQIVLYCYYKYGKRIKIISGCEHINEYLKFCGTPEEGYEIVRGTDNITSIKTEHSPNLDAYGFTMQVNGRTIVYTGDTKILNPFIPYIEDADELYVDVSKESKAHLRIDDVIQQLVEIKNKGTKVYLMHIDYREYIEKTVDGKLEMA